LSDSAYITDFTGRALSAPKNPILMGKKVPYSFITLGHPGISFSAHLSVRPEKSCSTLTLMTLQPLVSSKLVAVKGVYDF